MQKSFQEKKGNPDKKWYVVNLEDQVLGRAATKIANILRGRHKVSYTPHADTGDFVVVINAEKVQLTGNKWKQKTYYHHTGYIGGIKDITADKLLNKDASQIITKAVSGMLPKNKTRKHLLTRLKVYSGNEHPHTAQQPESLSLN